MVPDTAAVRGLCTNLLLNVSGDADLGLILGLKSPTEGYKGAVALDPIRGLFAESCISEFFPFGQNKF